MADKDLQYGIICIILSVVFLISGLDLLENTLFSKGLSSLLAFVLVAIGAYLIGQASK
jgi:multisubunit Na+/H+ antiporter MnhG subunit